MWSLGWVREWVDPDDHSKGYRYRCNNPLSPNYNDWVKFHEDGTIYAYDASGQNYCGGSYEFPVYP